MMEARDCILGFGEVMVASPQSKGGLESVLLSKGKRVTSLSGGCHKLFLFQAQNQSQNFVTSLHPQAVDLQQYEGQAVVSTHEAVMALDGRQIIEIKCAKEHQLVLTEQGQLFSYGKGAFGALGLGGSLFSPAPRLISKLAHTRIVAVACGEYHSLALNQNGDLFSWGKGFQGQLGLLKGIESVSSPQLITYFSHTKIQSIGCGSYHSMAIDRNKALYCWGQAMYGQIGTARKTKESVPIKVDVPAVTAVAGGFGHTLCLTVEGEIYAWGLNVKGQLGLNDLPPDVPAKPHLQYRKVQYGPCRLSHTKDMQPLPKFKAIACGFCSSYAIDQEGKAWSWGGGNLGFKDRYSERGPVQLTEGTENRVFSHVFANYNSVAFFSQLLPLFFKPAVIPSNGRTEVTFFGSGFVHTGSQCVRMKMKEETIMLAVEYDEKTGTFYCVMPNLQKGRKKEEFPLQCSVEISLDGKQFWKYDKGFVIYWSKTQIQSMEPQFGPTTGRTKLRIFMPMDALIIRNITTINVGFKANGEQGTHFQDWICSQGTYDDGFITCQTPSLPHFDPQNPFYLVDISVNGQQFTQSPQTFRFYSITDTSLTPHQGLESEEVQVRVTGKGLFDVAGKKLELSLQLEEGGEVRRCERAGELKWHKDTRCFSFRMPTLTWMLGELPLTPALLQAARAAPVRATLHLATRETIVLGAYRFLAPPPEPEEEKKDPKKQAKKAAKK